MPRPSVTTSTSSGVSFETAPKATSAYPLASAPVITMMSRPVSAWSCSSSASRPSRGDESSALTSSRVTTPGRPRPIRPFHSKVSAIFLTALAMSSGSVLSSGDDAPARRNSPVAGSTMAARRPMSSPVPYA